MNRTTPIAKFIKALANAFVEKNVEDAYKRLLGAQVIEYPFDSDGLMNDTLFEFKRDVHFRGERQAEVLAQLVCYLHEYSNKGVWKGKAYGIPLRVVGACVGSAFVVASEQLLPFYEGKYNFDRAASSPDEQLIKDLMAFPIYQYNLTGEDGVRSFRDVLPTIGTRVFKMITRENFVDVFGVWARTFATGHKPQLTRTEKKRSANQQTQLLENKVAQWAANAYLLDIQESQNSDSLNHTTGKVYLDQPGHAIVVLEVSISDYLAFWEMYHRPATPQELAAIIERKDQLVAIATRRVDGEFFTPIQYATKAHQYLARIIPDRYMEQGAHHSMYDDYNWYDPCCGTGNLTLNCPSGMTGGLFLSTLNNEDVQTVEGAGQNPHAHLFQCDFLNTEFDDVLPDSLLHAMTRSSKWIFILNPPFASAQNGVGQTSKVDVANTVIGGHMRGNGFQYAAKNLTAQFLYRIARLSESRGLEVTVATFSPPIFILGHDYRIFRSFWYNRFGFQGGFCVNSREFKGTKGDWPVVLTIWSSTSRRAIVDVDVFVENKSVGRKSLVTRPNRLSEWVKRPKPTVIHPPLSGAIKQYTSTSRLQEKLSADAIGYVAFAGNDVQHSNVCFLLSAPYGNNMGWSVTPSNMEQSIVALAARKLPKSTWLNNRDEFTAPDLSSTEGQQFSRDVIVYALFSNFNESSSLANVEYKQKKFDIKNEFFWLTKAEMSALTDLTPATWNQAERSNERYVAMWLRGKTYSPDVTVLLELGKELVKVSAGQRRNAQERFQLSRWDAGFYQVVRGLYGEDCSTTNKMKLVFEAFQVQYKLVTERLRPMVYELGFLPVEIEFESVDGVEAML